VAASLISDATFQAFRRPLRLRSASELPCSPRTFGRLQAATGPTNAADELAGVLCEAGAAGVPAADLELLGRLVWAGSPSHVARDYGVTPRTIRNRKNAAISRVRVALDAA
jgi:hypothetical protein